MTHTSAWLVLVFFILVVLFVLAERIFHFPVTSINKLTAISRNIYQQDLLDLFDPLKEQNLQEGLSKTALLRLQQERVHVAFEFERRMLFNVTLMQTVAYAEKERHEQAGAADPEKEELMKNIIELCVFFRLYSFVVLLKLAFWILFWRVLPTLRVSKLRKVAAFDGVKIYEGASQGIATLGGMLYGAESFVRVMTALGQPIPSTTK